MSMSLSRLLPRRALPPEVADIAIRDLQLDSRRLDAGDLFMAMPGERVDGRHFIDQAIRAGAAVIMAEATEEGLEVRDGVPVLGVPGLRNQTGALAARFFNEPGDAMTVIAVTGTNGKTSTAWFLRDALEALGKPCGLIGTLGAFFRGERLDTGHTTPDVVTVHRTLAVFRDAGAAAVVMEASSHALAQNRLDAVPVKVGVFTNLSHEHLDYHGTMEAYFDAKASLFRRPELALAVINADDDMSEPLAASLPAGPARLTYGAGRDNDVSFRGLVADADGMGFTLVLADDELPVRLPLFGRFNLHNVLAVAGVLRGLGHDAEAIGTALASLTPVPGRMEPVSGDTGPRVLVDYAHTPDALEKALFSARDHFSGKLICVLGCGGDRDRGKRPMMAAAAEQLADLVVFTADNPRSEPAEAIIDEMLAGISDRRKVQVELDRSEAVSRAIAGAGEEDMVLIAGKGHEAWQEIGGHCIPMDDRELARDALRERGGAA